MLNVQWCALSEMSIAIVSSKVKQLRILLVCNIQRRRIMQTGTYYKNSKSLQLPEEVKPSG